MKSLSFRGFVGTQPVCFISLIVHCNHQVLVCLLQNCLCVSRGRDRQETHIYCISLILK